MSSEAQNIDDMTFTDICEQVRQDYSHYQIVLLSRLTSY